MNKISFPLGIADGRYFCNRIKETNQLKKNIQHCRHTVLIAPRRYGKTSLAYLAIKKSKLPFARVDLFMTTNTSEIAQAIIAGIDSLLAQISNAENLLNVIKDLIKSLRPSFIAGMNGLAIKLEPNIQTATSATHICEALKILDRVLSKKSAQAVLFIDEFQEIERISPNQGIEGAIRNVAQESKNFTIIFSGSHRHLLQSMFNNKNQPLYRLCDEIHLERISEQDYISFIDKFALEKWGETLTQNTVQQILTNSESHPYYFNAICEKLFHKSKMPTATDVINIWNDLMLLKKKDILAETRNLQIIHKKILVAIAHEVTSELTGRKFLAQADLSGASVIRALAYLEENDLIEKKENRYHIIDPLLKHIINQVTFF